MSGQGAQDAKFFQRGKIQVSRQVVYLAQVATQACFYIGIPRRIAGSGVQGQEVHQTQDGTQEDRRQHYNGQ